MLDTQKTAALRFNKKRKRCNYDPRTVQAANEAWDAVVRASRLATETGDVGVRIVLATALSRLICDGLLAESERRTS